MSFIFISILKNPYQALIRICNYLGALPASSWTPVGQTPASLRQRSCRRLWSAASHWHQIRIKLLNRGSWWTWLDCALLSVDPPNHGSSSTVSLSPSPISSSLSSISPTTLSSSPSQGEHRGDSSNPCTRPGAGLFARQPPAQEAQVVIVVVISCRTTI